MIQGNRLKLSIKGSGLSMEKAAEKLGISRTTLYSYFTMAAVPLDAVQNVKEKLGIDIAETAPPKTEKPTSSDAGEVSADPALPGIYQDIVKELIESSKAQREISKALLEERDLIRTTANAAISLVAKTNEVAELRSSLDEMRRQLDGTRGVVQGIQIFAAQQLAVSRGISVADAADLLDETIMRAAGLLDTESPVSPTTEKKSKKGAVHS